MKKQLIIVFAICVLFLSACGSLVATSTSSDNSATHSASITTASAQSVCHVLQERQVQLSQQYHAASVQFNAARRNSLQAQQAEKTLIRLHQALTQVQAQLKTC